MWRHNFYILFDIFNHDQKRMIATNQVGQILFRLETGIVFADQE